ncbi:MAG: hypothetical protein DRP64_01960 [Verrucomicrobia bacterium]|nr:MAG: hypothetical protein DRP64_01960 [Verrucomicrobiota bacterium]
MAEDVYFDGDAGAGDPSWNTAINWNGDAVPTASSNVRALDLPGYGAVIGGPGVVADTIDVGDIYGNSGELTVDPAGSLSTTAEIIISPNAAGPGKLVNNGQIDVGTTLYFRAGESTVENHGTLTTTVALILGEQATASSTLLNTGDIAVGTWLYLSLNASNNVSVFNMDGGTVTAERIEMPGAGRGHLNLHGGTITLDALALNGSGNYTIDIEEGVLVVNSEIDTNGANYMVSIGLITAYGGEGTVVVDYNAGLDQSTLSAIAPPPTTDYALVLEDTFDTGGVATSDLGYNIGARQSGSAAPHAIISAGASLTATGELNVTDVTHSSATFTSPLGDGSFSVKVEGMQDTAPAGNATAFSVESTGNTSWGNTPMSVVIFPDGDIDLRFGSLGNIDVLALPNAEISAALGTTFDASDWHSYEIKANAYSATNGTWVFFVDGVHIQSGFHYAFEDENLKVSWRPTGLPADTTWDNLKVTFIDPIHPFVDTFDTLDSVNINQNLDVRQEDGFIPSGYTKEDFGLAASISGETLTLDGAGNVIADANFNHELIYKDFILSFDVVMNDTSDQWIAVYLYDSNNTWIGSSGSDFGVHILGNGSAGIFLVNDMDYVTDPNHLITVDAAILDAAGYPDAFSYDKTQKHTIELRSWVGAEGLTNTVDFVVDGHLIGTGHYSFPDFSTRTLQIISSFGISGNGGATIDNLALRYVPGPDAAYEQWAIGKGLYGPNDPRTLDVELDGLDNWHEWAYGGDPWVDDAVDVLPKLVDTTIVSPTVTEMTYVFNRMLPAVDSPILYQLYKASNLTITSWDDITFSHVSGTQPLDDVSYIQVTNSVPYTNSPQGFIELKVTE